MKSLSSSEWQALEYLYGGGDEEIECRSAHWVRTRFSHDCLSILHKGTTRISAGMQMVLESAKVAGRFGSCYTCQHCINAALSELSEKGSK